MTLQEQIDNLTTTLDLIKTEHASLASGKKAAAPRLRKHLMTIKKASHVARGLATDFVKELPTKTKPVEPKKLEKLEKPPLKRSATKKV